MDTNDDVQVKLLDALNRQTDAMERLFEKQNTTMERIELAIKTLEENSKLDHDDQPFPGHQLRRHEPAWRAAFDTLTAKMKEQAERWQNGTDSTLIFVALFVTVITAFQGPVSQNLSPDPADLTNEILKNLTNIVYEVALLNGFKIPSDLPRPDSFQPARSDEIITFFWYSALLLSLISAILSVFGRKWVEHLTKKPEGRTYKDRSKLLAYRISLADKLLRPVLGSLHPILILSIVLFIVGLHYQLWTVSFSADNSSILLLTSIVGSALIFCAATLTLGTLVHGVYWKESPFSTSMPSAASDIRQVAFRPRVMEDDGRLFDDQTVSLFCTIVKQMDEANQFDHVSPIWLFNEWSYGDPRDFDKLERALDAVVHVLRSDSSLKAKQTVAWNLCESSLLGSVLQNYLEEWPEKALFCTRRLFVTLHSTFLDASVQQEKIRLTFIITRIIILLWIDGDYKEVKKLNLKDINKGTLRKLFMKLFLFQPGTNAGLCAHVILGQTKNDAVRWCEEFDKKEPQLFAGVAEEYPTVFRVIFEKESSVDWRPIILSHLNEHETEELLRRISSESLKIGTWPSTISADDVLRVLSLVLRHRRRPLLFPEDFDLSNVITFLSEDTNSLSNLERKRRIIGDSIVLSCLTFMDNSVLARQDGLSGFLFKFVDRDFDIYESKTRLFDSDDIFVTPAAELAALLNRAATMALPGGAWDEL